MDNISKTYKKTEHNIYNNINKEAEIIANNYGVSQTVDCLAKSNAFISLKDISQTLVQIQKII